MMKLFVGKRIAKAMQDAWQHDGVDGKLGASVAFNAVLFSFGSGVINILKALT